jgi:hypothetical protein
VKESEISDIFLHFSLPRFFTAQFFDLVLDFVGHGLNFFVGESLKGAFDDFLAKGGVEEGKVFQFECGCLNGPLTLTVSPSDGERESLVRGLGRGLGGALTVRFHSFEFGLVFVAPIEEGWFGDVEMVGDASEAPALSAEVKELIYGFDRVHSLYLFRSKHKEGVGHLLSYRKSTESLGRLNEFEGLNKLNEEGQTAK